MKAEWKAKWCEALRSHSFPQGTGELRSRTDTKEYFCCLGVLRYLIDPESSLENDEGQYLHELHCEISGLQPGTSYGDEQGCLTRMNDSGRTFHEIADYIEKNL